MRLGSTSPYPTDVNYVGAGKVPILNNSPVVVLKDGKVAFVFGTPGGETIGQTEFQVLVNLIDFDMPVQQAIEAPRFALDAKPNFYKPGAEITVQIEGRVAGGNDCGPESDGTQSHRAARMGQPRTHAGDPRRPQDGDDDGGRRSAPDRVRDGLLSSVTAVSGFRAGRVNGPGLKADTAFSVYRESFQEDTWTSRASFGGSRSPASSCSAWRRCARSRRRVERIW